MTHKMIIRRDGQDFEVPHHFNVGMFGRCSCPGASCRAPLSKKDIIDSRMLCLTEDTAWTYNERLGMRQELRDAGMTEKDLPKEVGRSSLMETCSKCHQVFKGRDEIHKMQEWNNQLYCPTCVRK